MRLVRTRWLLPVGVAAGALVLMASGCPPPAQPTLFSQGFLCTGAPQSFIVPPGVTLLGVHVYGAQGGENSDIFPAVGGLGGKATGAMAVTPGQAVNVIVGCAGDKAPEQDGGYGYGIGGMGQSDESGAGGGASAVTNGTVVFVGGGGGGAGGDTDDGDGGGGGFPNGGTGLMGRPGCTGGGGGTQTAVGAGGTGNSAGQPGLGANGGDGDPLAAGGGGGGGGWYGGGGGGDECGGGGGSSYGPSGTTFENDARAGDGMVGIYWYA